jgi:hypothetical protein
VRRRSTGVGGHSGKFARGGDGGGGPLQLTLHPTGPGSVSGFTSSGCGANWDCVNDQIANAGSGTPAAEDGETTSLHDNNGQTNRDMFSLDDGLIPLGATVTSIEVRAQMGKGSGPAKYVSLSYQRVPTDASYIDGTSTVITDGTCC